MLIMNLHIFSITVIFPFPAMCYNEPEFTKKAEEEYL